MFDPAILTAIQRDAVARYPHEACGLVVAGEGYVPMANTHPEPEQFFEMPLEATERIIGGGVLAIVHSHTENNFDHPTVDDQKGQIESGLPWGLVICRYGEPETPFFWGEGIPEIPLMPRDFRWGPSGTDGKGDCFALVRDWYRLHKGIIIPETPRDEAWQSDDPDAYERGWLDAGFTPATPHDLEAGDGILFAIRSAGRPNHAGIYLGDGTILHHVEGRMARRESYGDWGRVACRWLKPPGVAWPR